MAQTATIGVVGGYGATGKAVVSELHKCCNGEILIGGRDLAKANALAAEFQNRVSAFRVDVLDPGALDEFCKQCSVVINCAGPVMLLQDRVAQAAFRMCRHYVDVAGMSLVKEHMQAHGQKIADSGLSFVVSAGWTPGMTELLPTYAYAQAKSRIDAIESVSVYFSDSGEWSISALQDGVSYISRAGLSRPGYFRKGQWIKAKVFEASRKVDLGDPIGCRRFGLFSMPELGEVGCRLTDCDFLSYSYVSGVRSAAAAIAIALLPLSEARGVRLLQNIFRRNRLSVAGFVVVHVAGRSEGRNFALRTGIMFDAGREYWMNGVVAATAARLILEGKTVQPGIHFLAEAVDPAGFMVELLKAGVELSEKLEPCR